MSKVPRKAGIYWATLDDGDGNLEIALLRVECYAGETAFENGAVCYFVDGSDRQFGMDTINQELVQSWHTIYLGIRTQSYHQEVKIIWHGEAKPPLSARRQEIEYNE